MKKFALPVLAAVAFALNAKADPTQLLTNGGFETGTFAGWTAATQAGSNGSIAVVANGGHTPDDGLPTQPSPDGGNFVVLTGQDGPGAYTVSQSFTVDPGASDVSVSFNLFASDLAGRVVTGPLNSTGPAVEFATADILLGGTNSFSMTPSDILSNLFSGATSFTSDSPWNSYSVDLGALSAGTYEIRFGEADNQGNFSLGVDNVSVSEVASAPDSGSSLLLAALGLAGLAVYGRRSRKARNAA